MKEPNVADAKLTGTVSTAHLYFTDVNTVGVVSNAVDEHSFDMVPAIMHMLSSSTLHDHVLDLR